jgi:hypothetical protein
MTNNTQAVSQGDEQAVAVAHAGHHHLTMYRSHFALNALGGWLCDTLIACPTGRWVLEHYGADCRGWPNLNSMPAVGR